VNADVSGRDRTGPFPLTLLFLVSLLPLLAASVWPEMPGVGDGEPLEVPLRIVIAPAYLLIALTKISTGISFPWSIAVIVPALAATDYCIVRLLRRIGTGFGEAR
jgi:hypothetical protein